MNKSLFTFLSLMIFTALIHGQTPGNLTVTATTSTAGGNYAPKNIVAIWIEDDQGNFVKTLLAYAATRKTHLNTWEASTTAAGSPFNVVDAITGATRSSHGTRTCTWNGTDVNGTVVPDGIYKVWMELTDKNATGNFSSFEFTKDTNAINITPFNVPSFASISITWEPVLTSVEDQSPGNFIRVFPNPTLGTFMVKAEKLERVQVRNATGALLIEQESPGIDLAGQPDGIYYVKIITGRGSVVKKVLKQSKSSR